MPKSSFASEKFSCLSANVASTEAKTILFVQIEYEVKLLYQRLIFQKKPLSITIDKTKISSIFPSDDEIVSVVAIEKTSMINM